MQVRPGGREEPRLVRIVLEAFRPRCLPLQRDSLQLTGLERRTSAAATDAINHAMGGHDALANVVARVGCLLEQRHHGAHAAFARVEWLL